MSFRHPASLIAALVVLLLKVGEDVCVAEEFRLVPSASNGYLSLTASNVRENNSILYPLVADVTITNHMQTWMQVTRPIIPGTAMPRPVGDTPLPVRFLLGPGESKTARDIQFPPRSTLQYDCERNLTRAPAAAAVFAIDLILRGLFTVPLSQEAIDNILDWLGFEFLEALGGAIGKESEVHLLAFMVTFQTAVRTGETSDYVEAGKRLAEFILSTKAFKEEVLRVVRMVVEENAVVYTNFIDKLVQFIDVYNKGLLLTPIVYDTFFTDESTVLTLFAKPITASTPTPPIAQASDIGGQPRVITPESIYAVTATYTDPNGREDLWFCYLDITHPTKTLTLMWSEDEKWVSPWAGEEGTNYLTSFDAEVRTIPLGYQITWKFRVTPTWLRADNSVNFGVFARDDTGRESNGGWFSYDSTRASFTPSVETPVEVLPTIRPGDLKYTIVSEGTITTPTATGSPTPGGGPGIPSNHVWWAIIYIVRGGDPDEWWKFDGKS